MSTTQNQYTGDGSNQLFSFTFPYIEESDVVVSVDGVVKTVITDYIFSNATTIGMNTAPASGAVVLIERNTSADDLKATFFPGSAIRARDLNDNFTQNLYVTQESQALTNTAVATANTAAAAVEGAFFYTPIADLAALPSSPANEDRVEIIDSTGADTNASITQLPTGFVGASGLSLRVEYSTSSSSWVFKQYFAADPEARYYPKASGTANASSIASNTSDISTNTGNIATNTGNISTNTANIATNTSNISTNTGNISTNATAISANATAIAANTADISTNTNNIATNTSNISTNTGNISTNTSDITALNTSVGAKMDTSGGTFTGDVSFDDNVIIKGDSTNGSGKLTLNCENNSHGIKIKGPPHSAGATYTLVLPGNTGNNGNSLVTDGSGNLSWGSPTADVSNKADIDDPDFTGTPTCPTPQTGSTNTEITNCGWVKNEISSDISGKANSASPYLSGVPTCDTAGVSTDTTQIANTAFVQDVAALKANKNNALLTGTPTLQTSPSLNDDSLKIATTAYVKDQIAEDAVGLDSPAFSGTPTAPTASPLTLSNLQIANTSYVQSNLSNYAPLANAAFSTTITATSPSANSNNTELATTAYIVGETGSRIQAYDVNTTKNDVGNTFTALQTFNAGLTVDGPYTQTVENGNSSVDLSTGNYFYKTLTANQDFSASGWVTNVPASGTVCSFTFEITVNTGYSITAWPTSVKWAGGNTPIFNAGKTHLAFFVTRDGGTTWYGSAITDFA